MHNNRRKVIALLLIFLLMSPVMSGLIGTGRALAADKSFSDHLSFIFKGLLMMWVLKVLTGDYLLGETGDTTPADDLLSEINQPGTDQPDSPPVEIIEEPVTNPDLNEDIKNRQSLSGEEKKMVELINQSRIEQGLPPLEVDMKMVKLAREKAQDMVDNQYFNHQSPVLGTPGEMASAAGINFSLLGENLGQGISGEEVHQAWLNSPDHRMNILDSRFTHVGVGVVQLDATTKVYVQLFIKYE
ncbi:MAG: CAP domain-containing protein [Halanaerobium sp.]|nr:CAP domain-containing protein [Halanaerobium sp.]